jgi:hypothetical protein
MDVRISFEGAITEDDSYHLKNLAQLIEEECDCSVSIETRESEVGIKDGGLAIGIAIASLVLTGIQTLVSVLQYWESQQSQYSISISITIDANERQKRFLMKNLSLEEIQSLLSQINSQPHHKTVSVKILKR